MKRVLIRAILLSVLLSYTLPVQALSPKKSAALASHVTCGQPMIFVHNLDGSHKELEQTNFKKRLSKMGFSDATPSENAQDCADQTVKGFDVVIKGQSTAVTLYISENVIPMSAIPPVQDRKAVYVIPLGAIAGDALSGPPGVKILKHKKPE